SASGRLTKLATIQNPVARDLRNVVGHLLAGLAPVQHAIAGEMTETAFSYSDSPLNGFDSGGGLEVGARVPPVAGEAPYGAGDTPRFTIRANAPAAPPPGLSSPLIDPTFRPTVSGGGISVVR